MLERLLSLRGPRQLARDGRALDFLVIDGDHTYAGGLLALSALEA